MQYGKRNVIPEADVYIKTQNSMMKAIFQAAESDSFWGSTVSALHTEALRAGYIIPASEWKELVSRAKAVFFVITTKGIIKRTKNDVVNIALMLHFGDRIPQVFK